MSSYSKYVFPFTVVSVASSGTRPGRMEEQTELEKAEEFPCEFDNDQRMPSRRFSDWVDLAGTGSTSGWAASSPSS